MSNQDPVELASKINTLLQTRDFSGLALLLREESLVKGMKNVAAKSNIRNEALYKALRPGAQLRLETAYNVISALGFEITISASKSQIEEFKKRS